jgi:diaminobutyrate-2-oxoglutarate transaminase
MSNATIDKYESEVRGYCRTFTKTWDTSEGAWLTDTEGEKYLDFFAGAGVLNYGHNHPALRKPLVEYIERGGITHSLDMYSAPKERFLETFHRVILEPRKMNHRVQFPGPTGTNATEAAMKLARKVTGRTNMAFFTNAFHGMTVGALAVTGNEGKRHSAAQPLANGTALPFDGYMGEGVDTLDYFEHVLEDRGSGVEMPAGVIVETVQAEGGVNVASREWMERLGRICKKHGILLTWIRTWSACPSPCPPMVCRLPWSCSSRSTTSGARASTMALSGAITWHSSPPPRRWKSSGRTTP